MTLARCCRRVAHLEQRSRAGPRRIWVYYEDARQAGETDAEALARQRLAPAPQDVIVRVRYEETCADALSPQNAADPLGTRQGRPVPEDGMGVADR
jgi:hypothetical protein